VDIVNRSSKYFRHNVNGDREEISRPSHGYSSNLENKRLTVRVSPMLTLTVGAGSLLAVTFTQIFTSLSIRDIAVVEGIVGLTFGFLTSLLYLAARLSTLKVPSWIISPRHFKDPRIGRAFTVTVSTISLVPFGPSLLPAAGVGFVLVTLRACYQVISERRDKSLSPWARNE